MRRNIVWEGADQLHYEIREIVGTAHGLQRLGDGDHLRKYRGPRTEGGGSSLLDQRDHHRSDFKEQQLCLYGNRRGSGYPEVSGGKRQWAGRLSDHPGRHHIL